MNAWATDEGRAAMDAVRPDKMQMDGPDFWDREARLWLVANGCVVATMLGRTIIERKPGDAQGVYVDIADYSTARMRAVLAVSKAHK